MRKSLLALAVIALAACASNKKASKPVTVSDSDYGRLVGAQTAPVDQARREMDAARDELARAKLRQTEAQQATAMAQADVGAADAELQRAAAQQKMGQESNDPAQLARARTMTESATLRKAAAQARMDYAQKLQAARAAEVEAAQQNVEFAEMRVEQAKLQALQQAQVPASGKYDSAQLDARVALRKKDLDEARSKAQAALAEATQAEQRWHELTRQLQARGTAPDTRG